MQIVDEFAETVKFRFAGIRQRIEKKKIYYYGGDLISQSQSEPYSVLPVFRSIIDEEEVGLLGFAGRLGFYASEHVQMREEVKHARKQVQRNAELQQMTDNLQRENVFLKQRIKILVAEKVKLNEYRFRELADLQQKLKSSHNGLGADVANEVFIGTKENLFHDIEYLKAALCAARTEAEQLKLDYLELKDANENFALKETRLMLKIDTLETKNYLLSAYLNIVKMDAEAQTQPFFAQQDIAKKRSMRKEAYARYLTDIKNVFRPPGAYYLGMLDNSNLKTKFVSIGDQAKHSSRLQIEADQVLQGRFDTMKRGKEMLDYLEVEPIVFGQQNKSAHDMD